MPDPTVYTSIDDVPFDTDIPPDIGDAPGVMKTIPVGHPSLALSKVISFIIPFTRVIKLGSKGSDVEGVKRALSKAGYIKWEPKLFTTYFGPFAVAATKRFQKQNGLISNGQIGPDTLKKLAKYFDQFAFFLYTGYKPGSNQEEKTRNGIVSYAFWGFNKRVWIHYLERRLMQYMDDLYHLPVSEDCSEFGTKCYKGGNAPDPNGQNPPYNGVGNTTTMRQNGRVVSIENAKPADLVQYQNPDHVAIYIGNNKVISHGSEGGPYLLPYNYRPVYEIRSYL